jgi:trk system potassium uptake protein TrkH
MTIPRTICLGFLAVITVGTLLLMMPFSASEGTWTNPLVALFTATSAVCVTGLGLWILAPIFLSGGSLLLSPLFKLVGWAI